MRASVMPLSSTRGSHPGESSDTTLDQWGCIPCTPATRAQKARGGSIKKFCSQIGGSVALISSRNSHKVAPHCKMFLEHHCLDVVAGCLCQPRHREAQCFCMQVEVRQHHGSESRFYFLQYGQLAAGQLLFLQLEERFPSVNDEHCIPVENRECLTVVRVSMRHECSTRLIDPAIACY